MVLTAAAFGGAFLVGLLAVPFWVYVLGCPIGRNLFGTLLFAIGQLGHGGSMIFFDGHGTATIRPYDKEENAVLSDDGWLPLKNDPTVYRFAWGDVVFDCDAAAAAPDTVLVDDTQLTQTDGGARLLNERRGEDQIPAFSDVTTYPALHYPKYLQQQRRQGNDMITRAKENALEEFGGDSASSQWFLLVLVLVGFVSMFAITFLMLGAMA